METKIISQVLHNELKKRQTSLNHCCPRSSEIKSKYGNTARDFLLAVTPVQQSILYKNIEDCYFGDYPTLSELNMAYSPKVAQAWIIPQLVDLSEFCGVKEKFTQNQLNQCSDIIANDFFYLKTSEIMLFFAKFKRCCYGRFYGSVDPLVIIESLKKFCIERNKAYYDKEEKENERRIEESLKKSCTWEEYAERNGVNKSIITSQESSNKSKVNTSLVKKEDVIRETILNVATSLINKSYGNNEECLDYLRSTFKKKYGCSPEQYIAENKE